VRERGKEVEFLILCSKKMAGAGRRKKVRLSFFDELESCFQSQRRREMLASRRVTLLDFEFEESMANETRGGTSSMGIPRDRLSSFVTLRRCSPFSPPLLLPLRAPKLQETHSERAEVAFLDHLTGKEL